MKQKPIVLLVISALLALASVGAAQEPPTWTSSPASGPSPNTIQVQGTQCRVNPGGALVPGEAVVELLQPGGTSFSPVVTQTYMALEDGSWGGTFAIPAGLDPAIYPLKALCRSPGGGPGLGFDYTNRSYTVVGSSATPTATPVETEVTFTG